MTNPTTLYISNYAAQIYPSYKSALDSKIQAVKAQFSSAGAYGGSRMYIAIGEEILSSEKLMFGDLFGAVEYYQAQYDISISETLAIFKTYADSYKAYTNSLASSATTYATLVTNEYNNQLLQLISLTTPWVVISPSASVFGAGQTGDLIFRLSEPSNNFEAVDISVTGGVISQFSGTGNIYTARFIPTPNYKGVATINVVNEQFTDLVGNPNLDGAYNKISLAVDTSIPVSDTTAPTASTFSPTDEATAVAIGANVVVTFNENIQRGTGNIVLKKADGTTVATYTQSNPEVTVSGSTLTINPASDLNYSTGYKVEFAAGSVQDLAGNNYPGTTIYNFTTGVAPNTVPPTALSFNPADETTTVAVGSNIVVTFSENIQRGPGNIVLKKADGTVVESYAQSSLNITTSGSILTINPTVDLGHSSDYILDISYGSVKDFADNNFQGSSEYNFTTAAAQKFTPNLNLPEVISLGVIQGKNRNLVNPIQFEDGKIYYLLDANGDGKNSYVPGNIPTYYLDSVSHDFLDNLLNFGADTFDTQPNGAIYGIDDARTVMIGSLYLSLPTAAEFSASFGYGNKFWRKGTQYSTSDSIPVPGSNSTQKIYPTIDWNIANPFWLATKSNMGHYFGTLENGTTGGDNPFANSDSFQSNFALFQVLFSNSTPVVYSANILVAENVSKIGALSGTDVDGNTLTFAKVADPSHGIVTINSVTGAYTYTPNFNYNGSDSFTFKVNDGTVDSAVATVSITVAGMNDAPDAPDTTAPTVTAFSPADEATAVAIGANVVVTFSEAIQRGAGNIVLKTSEGVVVATYDAATSTNLSISGSTLTIDPGSDLSYSTGYKVEFAAGSIKDIVGNRYHGVIDYNFTTLAPFELAP